MKSIRDVIVRPVVSEKSYAGFEQNTYTFVVDPRANKTEIKEAVQAIWSVRVTSVNTLRRRGKVKRTRFTMGKRPDAAVKLPDVASFPADKVEAGKNSFVLRCAQCHSLGKVIETPLAAQQGPDLIRSAGRVDYEWARNWILDPKKIDPKTKMLIPGGMTPDDVDNVRMFTWKASVEAGGKR